MDVKDLRSETVLNERNNDGSKYAPSVAVPCNSNKLYQDMGQNSVGKVDIPPSRPCAVIGPDRVVPPPVSNETLKKGTYEAWCAENMYRHPPEYPHKMSGYQTPIRNISPRQTFQENMQRIMVPPSYNSFKGSEDPNFQEKNVSLSKNIKPNIPVETKYCEVPYNLTNSEQKNSRNTELCVPSANPVLTRTAPHGWPPNVRPTRPGTLPASFGAPELYQYPEFTNCAGPRPVPINRPHRMVHDETAHVYPDHYSHDGNIRFKPYPTSKERYPQARYEYITNYPTPFQTPPAFSQQKYDLQKPMPSPYPYPPVPLKYLDSRIVDPSMDGYQRPTPQNNYNLPFRNQIIHPAYGPVLGNCVQNKYPCPTDGSLKPVAPNKLPYDTNKTYVDYENVRNKTFPPPENFYYSEIPRTHHAKSQLMSNFTPVSVHGIPPYPYYRKENLPVKNYEFMHHYRNMDPSYMPMSRIPSQFSPGSIAISPSDSNASNDTTQLQSNSQEDCGYVSQSPTASIRSFDSAINRADFYRRYESRYGHTLRMSMMSKPEQSSINNMNSKDKKGIDVRQFLQMWNEVDDENCENSTKDTTTQLHSNDVSTAPKNQYEIHKNQDQLYVLGLVNVPNEELSKYEHIQKVSKLPENIKGYNNIELLKQFEEVIESSNVNNFNARLSNPRDIGYRSFKGSVTHQTADLLQRPVSPLDVEAKISQSVIHKEVGCNFEIKPCSPKMLNVEVATPVQTVLGERVIEKVTNPLNMAPSILHVDEKMNCNINTHKDHKKSSIQNLEVSSCKMINTSYVADDHVRSNYSLQDLESNSGVCLASLPRLDNDIELNFPEVNQQFINANKGDSVITKTNDLPALTLEQSEHLLRDNEKSSNPESEMSYECSPSIIESEREFTKLSKFRKKKIDPGVTEMDLSFVSSQNIRTDSVIIKNPENTKVIELNKVVSPINELSECPQESSCNLSGENDINIKAIELNDEVDLPMENAIDFSLKSDNSNFTSVSPLNKFIYDDANQTKKSKSKLPEDTKLCNIENKTDSSLLQTNSVNEKLKNNNTSLIDNGEEGDKSVAPSDDDIKENYVEISNTAREIKTIGSLLTEINDNTQAKVPTYAKNINKTSRSLNNSSINANKKQRVNVKKYNDYSQSELNLDSIITTSQNCNLIFDEENRKYETPKNQVKRTDVNIATSKHESEDNSNITSSCKNKNIEVQNNLKLTQDDSYESDNCTVESDSDSKSSSRSTSIRDDTESEAECTLNKSILQSIHHSPSQKQNNTECDKSVPENNTFFDRNANNSPEKNKIVEKLNKELLSPRIQNLLTYSEGSTRIHPGTHSNNEHNHISIKDGNEGKIYKSKLAITADLNNYDEKKYFISNEHDTDMTTMSIQNDCNEKNNVKIIDGIIKTMDDLKSFDISHEENKATKSKNIAHRDENSCNYSSKDDHCDDSCSINSEGNNNSQEEETQSKSLNNYMKCHTQSANNFNDPDNSLKSFCDKNIDNQIKCVEKAHECIKQDNQDILNLKYAESVFDENINEHLDNNDIKQNTQFINNSNDHDDCINSFCDKNIDDQVKCEKIAYDNIKQDTEDVLNFKSIESIFYENTDKEQKNAEMKQYDIKNFKNENNPNHNHGNDTIVSSKNGESELESKISYNNTKENVQDSKYSGNTCSERLDGPNYLNRYCYNINQDNQSDIKTNHSYIEDVEKIQTSNKNRNYEKIDTEDISGIKYTISNVEFCNKNPMAEMLPKKNEKHCHEDGRCIQIDSSNIYTDEQTEKSIEILRDNITEKVHIKNIEERENGRSSICDKNAEADIKFPENLDDDRKVDTEQKPVLEEELKSEDMLHAVPKENAGKEPVSEEELKSAELLQGDQKENTKEPLLEELKSPEILHDDQKENCEKEQEEPILEKESIYAVENTEETVTELKSAEMFYDDQKENTEKEEETVSKEESKFAKMQQDNWKENPKKGNDSEEVLKSAEMLHDNQKENTEELNLEEELKSLEMIQDDEKKNIKKEFVSKEESKFAMMQYNDRKENTEKPCLKKELKSIKMLQNAQEKNTEEPVSEEELKFSKMQHDDRKENTEGDPVSEKLTELSAEMLHADLKENTDEEHVPEAVENSKLSAENLKVDITTENYIKKDTLNVTSAVCDPNSNNNNDQPNDFVNNNDITKDFTNPTIVTYQQIVKHSNKDTEVLLDTNDLQPFTYVESSVESSIKEKPVKEYRKLKRSLSESELDNLNNDSRDNFNLEWQVKRRKNNVRSFMQPHLWENNFCSIQNNRRNSVSAMYADENVSICILIDDNCIITEEDENSEEQEKICFAEISESYLSDAQGSANQHEDTGSPTEILLCPQEENNQYSESENIEFVEEKKFEQEDNQYHKREITDFVEEKSFEESWVEDIACVETVVSEDIVEDEIISAHSSPKKLYSPEHEDTEVFLNSEHADKVKYIYGDKMCSDDAQFLETLYRTPQMNVNKTLISRESHTSDDFNQFYNTDSLEQMLSQSNSCEDIHNELDTLSSNTCLSQSAQIIKTKEDKENFDTKNVCSIATKTLFSNDGTNEQKPEHNKIEKTQDDTVHSCESSTDNVFSYTQKDDYTKNAISSSPEVSSTTSEEKNLSILLKITNYQGSRLSHVNNTGHETKRISCKFTEVNDYSTSLFNGKTPNRPLITKAAQKYIPPLKESIEDLKIRLRLPEDSLLKLKQLKLLKEEPKHNKYIKFSKKELPKKPKPKFEDVLKSIDEIQFQKHKENKRTKKSIPKVVIKKNENGAHYASTTKKNIFNPDLTGRKWQPWVFLEKNHFIDKMAIKNKKIAVYSHRKSTYVLAEKFQKYKSCSTKFVITQPKLDDTSIGRLKCTIRLKHT